MIDFDKITKQITDGYKATRETEFECDFTLPDRKEVSSLIQDLRKLFFPAYFAGCEAKSSAESFAKPLLNNLYLRLKKQIVSALSFKHRRHADEEAEQIVDSVTAALPEVQRVLLTDVQATFEGDPAAKSKEEIIVSYPGFFAIFVYRLAHLLYKHDVPFIPRMMTEFAHDKTGIDINPGAEIGEYFFIDHGTGIVIGETAVIGNRVKIYQGVTLGALSPRKGQSLAGVKRHPTVEDNVTLYSGASVLGGETVIGEGAVIGGNTLVLESVQKGAKVSTKRLELIIK